MNRNIDVFRVNKAEAEKENILIFSLAVLLGILFYFPTALCQTEVSGEVSGRWTVEGSPYFIPDTVIVPDGEVLEVDPGVRIIFHAEFNERRNFYAQMFVDGALRLNGAEGDSVHITCDNPELCEPWGFLPKIRSDLPQEFRMDERIDLEYVVLEYIYFDLWDHLPQIMRHCRFGNLARYVIDMGEIHPERNLHIRNNIFSGRALIRVKNALLVHHNTISENGNVYISTAHPPSQIQAYDNTLIGDLHVEGANAWVHDNLSPDLTGSIRVEALGGDSLSIINNHLGRTDVVGYRVAYIINNTGLPQRRPFPPFFIRGINENLVINDCHNFDLHTEYVLEMTVDSCTGISEISLNYIVESYFTNLEFENLRQDWELGSGRIRITGDTLGVCEFEDCEMLDPVWISISWVFWELSFINVNGTRFEHAFLNSYTDQFTVLNIVNTQFPDPDDRIPELLWIRDFEQINIDSCFLYGVKFDNSGETSVINSRIYDIVVVRCEIDVNQCTLNSLGVGREGTLIARNNLFLKTEDFYEGRLDVQINNVYPEIWITDAQLIMEYNTLPAAEINSDRALEGSRVCGNIFYSRELFDRHLFRIEGELYHDYNVIYNLTDPYNWDVEPSEHELQIDPRMRHPLAFDFRLRPDSPCIDAGHPDDRDPDRTRADIGAYFFDRRIDNPPAVASEPQSYAGWGSDFRYIARGADDRDDLDFTFHNLPDWFEIIDRNPDENEVVLGGAVPNGEESFSFLIEVEDSRQQTDTLSIGIMALPHTIVWENELEEDVLRRGSYFFVNGLHIPPEAHLTVEPGCTLTFRGVDLDLRQRLKLVVDGELTAGEANSDSILFNALPDTFRHSPWSGIQIGENAGIELWNANIEDGSAYQNATMRADSSAYVCLHHCQLMGSAFLGARCGEVVFDSCWFSGSGYSIKICHCNRLSATNNKIFDTSGDSSGFGIYIFSTPGEIKGNEIINREYGIKITYSSRLYVEENKISHCPEGIDIVGYPTLGVPPGESDSIWVYGNTIENSSECGIKQEYGGLTTTYQGNLLSNCNTGFDFRHGQRRDLPKTEPVVYNSLVLNCGIGVRDGDIMAQSEFRNCLFVDCDTVYVMDWTSMDRRLINCGFIGNRQIISSAVRSNVPEMLNCGFLDNFNLWGGQYYRQLGRLDSANVNDTPCDIYGNVFTDPLIDIDNGSFRLAENSIWIDAGQPDDNWLDPDGSTADIGLYGGPFGADPLEIPYRKALTPDVFTIGPVYPNPFNSVASIKYGLEEAQRIKVGIFDANGRLVEVLAEGNFSAGYHNLSWNASDATSGVYFVKLTAKNTEQTQPLLLLK